MGLTDEQYRKVMRKGWNLTPNEYDRLWIDILRPYSLGCVERAGIRAGDRVIDIASGPGVASLLSAERVGPDGKVLGTDISDSFIDVARALAEENGLGNIAFERHAMEQLGVPDASFDAAICVLGLMYAAPVETALAEVKRVLRPAGRFAACVWGVATNAAFARYFRS